MRVKVQPAANGSAGPSHSPDGSAAAQNHMELTEIRHPGSVNVDKNELSKSEPFGCFPWTITVMAWIIVVLSFPISLFFIFKIAQEYERAVIFRLGRVATGQARGPGIFVVLPFIDHFRKIDLRTVNFDVPPQEILSKDSVTVAVDAIVYYRIYNATKSVTNVEDANKSTRLLAQTTVRQILGTKTLSEMLSEKGNISDSMKEALNSVTEPWGVRIERIEVRDIRLPENLQRAMASEAEATREARAGIILAEGEKKASMALAMAAKDMDGSGAIQLRYLQTLCAISSRNNHTIMFPFPTEILKRFSGGYKRLKPPKKTKVIKANHQDDWDD